MGAISFDRLLKLRLVVARFGEMDGAKWWNTSGLLGRHGAILMSRGMPKTHFFAQARTVFAVAQARCNEVFNPPRCVTLWNLPAALEDQFDARWHGWLDQAESWKEFFIGIQAIAATDLLQNLRQLELITDDDVTNISRLRRSTEGKAVPISETGGVDDPLLTLLAGGFFRSEIGKLAVPYARVEA
jgi:hypothetical protein